MLIDTHAHTYYLEDENADEILKECQRNNIKVILNGIDKESNKQVIELSKKFNNVYAAIGYDHSVVNKITDEDLKLLEEQIKIEKIVAIGEIGLDYYWTKDNKEQQKDLFIKQLDLAKKYDLPVIIHSRDAVQDVFDILKSRNNKGSIHCYSGSTEMAKEFIKIGFYIGIDGPITFKNNKKQKEMIKEIDINHILVETDSPYLSPEPKRGQKNSSLNLKYIVKKIADELSMEYDEIEKITSNNATTLFDLKD
jgi:TatD DNase family protein